MEEMKKCDSCGESLAHKKGNARFCSDTCRYEFHNHNKSKDSHEFFEGENSISKIYLETKVEQKPPQGDLKKEMETLKKELKSYRETIRMLMAERNEFTEKMNMYKPAYDRCIRRLEEGEYRLSLDMVDFYNEYANWKYIESVKEGKPENKYLIKKIKKSNPLYEEMKNERLGIKVQMRELQKEKLELEPFIREIQAELDDIDSEFDRMQRIVNQDAERLKLLDKYRFGGG